MKEDCENSNVFVYTYSAPQQAEIRAIHQKYLPCEENVMARVRRLLRSMSDRTEESERRLLR